MNPFDALHTADADQKALVILLALLGEPVGKTRLVEYLRTLGIRDDIGRAYTAVSLTETMGRLRRRGWVADAEQGTGSVCPADVVVPALRMALDEGSFEPICAAIESGDRRSYDGHVYLRNYRQGLARLRI